MSLDRHTQRVLCIIIVILNFTKIAQAKSVYVISNTEDSNVAAYKIQGSSLSHQVNYICQSDLTEGVGAVGLAIDESEYGDFLFVTFEGENTIEVVNAKSMKYVDTVESPDPYGTLDLAGIVIDKNRRKVYAINRRTNNLYVYSWDAEARELTLDYPDPYYVELADCCEGYGLAFDYENDRLYVADDTNVVKCYDANDPNWAKLEDFTFGITDTAVGIAVDVNKQHVYTGASQFGSSTYITKYDLDANTETRVNVGSPVLGIAVDQDSSLVYLTTYGSGQLQSQDRLMIYDSNLVKQSWESGDIGNPAGVAVGEVAQYKPAVLKLAKYELDPNDPNEQLRRGDYITYRISYDANGHSANDVEIIDYLPDDVDFNSASGPNSTYDSNEPRTVTWRIGRLSPTDVNSVTLSLKVKQTAPVPVETMINFCEMESDWTYNWAYCVTPDIIYVDMDANDSNETGMSWRNAFLDVEDGLASARRGIGRRIWVAAGTETYKPTVPSGRKATFSLVDGVRLYGGFSGDETTLRQRNWISNETILDGDNNDDTIVTAQDVSASAFIDGFTIKSGKFYGIWCGNSSLGVANCEITDNYDGVYCEDNSSVSMADCNIGGNDGYQGQGGYGVYCYGSKLIVSNCIVQDNNNSGIYCFDSNVTVVKCTIGGNSGDGIYSLDSTLMVSNSIIEDNGGSGAYHEASSEAGSLPCIVTNNIIRGNSGRGVHYYYFWAGEALQVINNWIHNNGRGIYVQDVWEPVLIRNNTVADNNDYGIYAGGDVVNPNVSNCIVWGNANGQLYTDDPPFANVTYSCIQNGGTTNGNINTDPCFVNDVCDNYHLDPNAPSPCIDAGDPNGSYGNETDIDGEIRLFDGDGNGIDRVDMGADELYWSPADFDANKIVNFVDYAMLGDFYGMDDTDGNYNDVYDLMDNDCIDNNDVGRLCEEWLWEPAWTKGAEEMEMMMGGGGFSEKIYAAGPAQQEAVESESEAEGPDPEHIEKLIEDFEEMLTDEKGKEGLSEEQWEKFVECINDIIDWLKKELEEAMGE